MDLKFRDDIFLGFAVIVSALAIYFGLYIAPAEVELGELVRVFYLHLPQAIICYLSLVISVITAILFLVKKDPKYDALSETAALLGLVYGATTLLSGSIWANAAWGVYWNWDPRETTTLILWLAYVGYFFLRMSVENPERRASVSAAYNVLSFLTVPLSYMSFILWPSLHPRLGTEGGLGLTGTMVQALLLNILGGLLLFIWIFRKAYGVRLRRDEFERLLSEEMRDAS
ncbi:cytochrome C assembly protein [Candidatus Bathyarchaeota archaeon]|nr:MAG: cytochrome C assembly protein [Candidatus Bathyarchaeota archaeon]